MDGMTNHQFVNPEERAASGHDHPFMKPVGER